MKENAGSEHQGKKRRIEIIKKGGGQIEFGNANIAGTFTRIFSGQGKEPVKGISADSIALLKRVLEAQDSGIQVKGDAERGYQLRYPEDKLEIRIRDEETIYLPGDKPSNEEK